MSKLSVRAIQLALLKRAKSLDEIINNPKKYPGHNTEAMQIRRNECWTIVRAIEDKDIKSL